MFHSVEAQRNSNVVSCFLPSLVAPSGGHVLPTLPRGLIAEKCQSVSFLFLVMFLYISILTRDTHPRENLPRSKISQFSISRTVSHIRQYLRHLPLGLPSSENGPSIASWRQRVFIFF